MSNIDENDVNTEDLSEIAEEEEYYEWHRRRKKSILPKVVLFFVFLLIAVLGMSYYYFTSCQKPIQKESEIVSFVVDEDSTIMSVTEKLEDEGIIKDARMAYYYARLNELTNIYFGEYELDKSWPLETILNKLNDPLAANQNIVEVTIIEGDWAKHIATKLSNKTDASYEDFMNLWNNQEWIRSLMNEYPFLTEEIFNNSESRCYLEGYLAPDTYQFKKDSDAEEITLKILDQSRLIYLNYKDDFQNIGLSLHEIYSLASIIQFEAGNRIEDQKEISGIFYNRMNEDMRLESSVTVCYAIDYNRESDSWEKCETSVDAESSYNTYLHEGLTPGPICNFSASCLDAALHPNQTDNYYFMADVYGDGTIYYAKTFEEHANNVNTYLNGNE